MSWEADLEGTSKMQLPPKKVALCEWSTNGSRRSKPTGYNDKQPCPPQDAFYLMNGVVSGEDCGATTVHVSAPPLMVVNSWWYGVRPCYPNGLSSLEMVVWCDGTALYRRSIRSARS
jgi:hypothetical protein